MLFKKSSSWNSRESLTFLQFSLFSSDKFSCYPCNHRYSQDSKQKPHYYGWLRRIYGIIDEKENWQEYCTRQQKAWRWDPPFIRRLFCFLIRIVYQYYDKQYNTCNHGHDSAYNIFFHRHKFGEFIFCWQLIYKKYHKCQHKFNWYLDCNKK